MNNNERDVEIYRAIETLNNRLLYHDSGEFYTVKDRKLQRGEDVSYHGSPYYKYTEVSNNPNWIRLYQAVECLNEYKAHRQDPTWAEHIDAQLLDKINQKNGSANTCRIDKLVDKEGSHVKAIASVTIGGEFTVHGIRVMDSAKGLFVQMPQRAVKGKEGETEYSDVFHPVTAVARADLNKLVLDAYAAKVKEVYQEKDAAAKPTPAKKKQKSTQRHPCGA